MPSILIVEDEAKMRRLLELNLGEQGFTTHAVADAEAGLKLLGQEKVDLVVTDFRLPGMNGLEFLQAIKQVNASLPVVMMTAYGSVESAVEAMKMGASDYVLKPFSLEEMTLVVKPHMGWRGEGVRIVRGAAELLALPAPREPVLVQEFLPGTGVDLRVYVAGSRVFATRKPFSSSSFSVPGQPAAVSEEVREIALRCGAAFGLELYGLDLIETQRGPFVVDVNYFPGYKGLPDAAEAVADHVALSAGAEDVPGAAVFSPRGAGPSLAGVAR